MDFPFPYNLRVSKRARYLRVEISPEKGILVVTPQGVPQSKIQTFLKEKESWIQKHWNGLSREPQTKAEQTRELPQEIGLLALEDQWPVEYHREEVPWVMITEENHRVLLTGKVQNKQLTKKALQKWLVEKGKNNLLPWLESLAQRHNFSYKQGKVRCQKTRWGSCSAEWVINLNAKLLFLPTYLVQYVCLHELCHTLHMNHSKEYWRKVKKHEPNYSIWEEELKSWERYIPWWAL